MRRGKACWLPQRDTTAARLEHDAVVCSTFYPVDYLFIFTQSDDPYTCETFISVKRSLAAGTPQLWRCLNASWNNEYLMFSFRSVLPFEDYFIDRSDTLMAVACCRWRGTGKGCGGVFVRVNTPLGFGCWRLDPGLLESIHLSMSLKWYTLEGYMLFSGRVERAV